LNKHLKMALFLNIFNISFLNAFTFDKFKTISWDWISIGLLFILFLIVFLSIIKDLKKKKAFINENLIEEKRKNKDSNNYLNDINLETLKSTKELDKTIETLSYSYNDKEIIKKLRKSQKEIFANVQEENIFLHIATNKDIGKQEIFKLKDIIKELKDLSLLENSKVNIDKDTPYNIVANKEIIQSIIFLISKLQLKEHELKEAIIDISINSENSRLTIKTPKNLQLNSNIEFVIENSIEPMYNQDDKKYYGVYLYLIDKLLDRVSSKLIIDKSDNRYGILVDMPIEINKDYIDINKNVTKQLKEKKNALIISKDANIANIVSVYLSKYNFEVDIDLSKELNKEIPNFLNYQLVLMDAQLYEPILSNYILSVKKYSDLKIVSLEENGKIYNYPSGLIDAKIDTSFVEEEINGTILKLFGKELIDIASEEQDIIEPIETKEDTKKESIKVLIADDDRTNLHILEYLLKQYGLEVCSASNGEEALEVLKENECDLIILDSIMPKMDGFETVKHIRANKKYNSTPVIIHTSFSLHNNSIENIFKLGFDSYLPKPFNKYELKALLERYVELDDNIVKIKAKEQEIEYGDHYKEDIQEFLAIYGDSDKLLERYIKENRNQQALDVIRELKKVSHKIGADNFIDSISEIEEKIIHNNEIDANLIYNLSNSLQELKSKISKKLSA